MKLIVRDSSLAGVGVNLWHWSLCLGLFCWWEPASRSVAGMQVILVQFFS